MCFPCSLRSCCDCSLVHQFPSPSALSRSLSSVSSLLPSPPILPSTNSFSYFYQPPNRPVSTPFSPSHWTQSTSPSQIHSITAAIHSPSLLLSTHLASCDHRLSDSQPFTSPSRRCSRGSDSRLQRQTVSNHRLPSALQPWAQNAFTIGQSPSAVRCS